MLIEDGTPCDGEVIVSPADCLLGPRGGSLERADRGHAPPSYLAARGYNLFVWNRWVHAALSDTASLDLGGSLAPRCGLDKLTWRTVRALGVVTR